MKKRLQLKEIVKKEVMHIILESNKKNRTLLPSEEKLAQQCDVSRVTIRAVLSELEMQGYVTRKQGIGTYINPVVNQLNVSFSPVISYNKMIEEYGYKTSSTFLDISIQECALLDVQKKLHLKEKQKCVQVKKVYLANQTPCVYCVDYFSEDVLQKKEDLKAIPNYPYSLFEFLKEKTNHTIQQDYTKLSTVNTFQTPELKDIFHLKKEDEKSFLLLTCVNYDQHNNAILYSYEYVDTTIISFYAMRKKDI